MTKRGQFFCFQGKVPRNEYGNVELFKPSMLPAGACHIQGTIMLNILMKISSKARCHICSYLQPWGRLFKAGLAYYAFH